MRDRARQTPIFWQRRIFHFWRISNRWGSNTRTAGRSQDAFQILKNHGVNCVRLRLFTSSQAQAASDPYDYINNTNYTVPLAVRVKNAGLLFSLDFHYSDTWADPGPSGHALRLDQPDVIPTLCCRCAPTTATPSRRSPRRERCRILCRWAMKSPTACCGPTGSLRGHGAAPIRHGSGWAN